MRQKELAFAGKLYPKTCAEMRLLWEKLERFLSENLLDSSLLLRQAKLIIAPYGAYEEIALAGYFAHKLLANNPALKRLFILSPLSDSSLSAPLYRAGVDRYVLLARELEGIGESLLPESLRALPCLPHSIPTPHSEVQLPFISYHFRERAVGVEELFYAPKRSDLAGDSLAWLLEALGDDPSAGIILSERISDLRELPACLSAYPEPLLFPSGTLYSLAYPPKENPAS